MLPTTKILDIPITILSQKQGVEKFIDYVQQDSGIFFAATPNAEIILESLGNLALKEFLEISVLNFCDSVSLRWAIESQAKNWSKIRAILELIGLPFRQKKWQRIPETICGSDIFEAICEAASHKNISIFLLGGQNGVGKKTKEKLEKKFPNIKIVGTDESFVQNESEAETLLKKIRSGKPKIIFVAYGCPKQELWLKENLSKIPSARIGMGIGGSFDFYAGTVKRAPKVFRKLGLEWFWRLIRQPQRIRRIFHAVFIFPQKILFPK